MNSEDLKTSNAIKDISNDRLMSDYIRLYPKDYNFLEVTTGRKPNRDEVIPFPSNYIKKYNNFTAYQVESGWITHIIIQPPAQCFNCLLFKICNELCTDLEEQLKIHLADLIRTAPGLRVIYRLSGGRVVANTFDNLVMVKGKHYKILNTGDVILFNRV